MFSSPWENCYICIWNFIEKTSIIPLKFSLNNLFQLWLTGKDGLFSFIPLSFDQLHWRKWGNGGRSKYDKKKWNTFPRSFQAILLLNISTIYIYKLYPVCSAIGSTIQTLTIYLKSQVLPWMNHYWVLNVCLTVFCV